MTNTKKTGQTNTAISKTSSGKAGLGNPALAVVATQAADQVPWGFIFKTVVYVTIAGVVIYKITHRFEKKSEDSDYHPASISKAQAETRAEAIYRAMKGLGNGFEIVRDNMVGLNYNGYIRLYNAFGNREGTLDGGLLSSGENMEEWFHNQFSDYEKEELRVLANFF